MNTLIQANIFFFISSLSVLVITFFVVLLLLKLRRLVGTLNILVEKLKDAGDYVGDEAKELMEDIKQSPIFRLFFPRRKKSKKPEATKIVKRKV